MGHRAVTGDESRARCEEGTDAATGRGDQRLRQALARLRRPREPAPPLCVDPTNAFEVAIAEQLKHLRADVDRLQGRINWLLGLIIAAAVTNVLLAVLQ